MLFYQIEAQLNTVPEISENTDMRDQALSLQPRFEMFYQKYGQKIFVCISSVNKKSVTAAAVAKDRHILNTVIADFWETVSLEVSDLKISEVTLRAFEGLLRMGDRNNYLQSDDEVFELLGLGKIANRFTPNTFFSEFLLNTDRTKAQLLKMSADMLCGETLKTELNRIYKGSRQKGVFGHPVHYIIKTDDCDIRNRMLDALLCALYRNERIQSKRYCLVNCTTDATRSNEPLDTLYKISENGAVVISFNTENPDDSEYARPAVGLINRLCEIMHKNKDRVLTVFCFPHSCEKIKNAFYSRLENCTIVELSEETVSGKKAVEYLSRLAKNHGAEPPESLYKGLGDMNKGYLTADLNKQFDQWFSQHLKTEVFPQYKQLESISKSVAEQQPKGSAYDSLQDMIGLAEAKTVIAQALDFYKAQKLFKEQGFKSQRPAMHMVFTGNPGTAKTTVARLFAQIMKDNGLLSKGDLYELGRADIVGKYVGWTAQIVKERFREAKGSVLFLDEAYSLVDDRNGQYGDEAINTIVQEMENRREDIVVIFAGYPDKMEEFISRNPGLRSRIAFHVPFHDYTARELIEITALIARENGVKLTDGAREKLLGIFETQSGTEGFGNGRFARNLFEKAVMKQSSRLVKMPFESVTKEDVKTLIAEDFEAPATTKHETARIGFSC